MPARVSAKRGSAKGALQTRGVSLWPWMACLREARKMLSSGRRKCEWRAVNDAQTRFLQLATAGMTELGGRKGFRAEELKSKVAANAKELNEFLKREGFDIRLAEFGSTAFGVASVLRVKDRWAEEASEGQLTHKRRTYPAICFKGHPWGTPGVRFLRNDGHDQPIAEIETKRGDRVYVTVVEKPPADDFELVRFAACMLRAPAEIPEFCGLKLPMVDFDQQPDASWLVGLKTADPEGMPWEIAQAKQQIRFKMNEAGFLAESAAAMELRATALIRPPVRPPLVIDKPFMLWIMREGLSYPIFTGFFATDVWRAPGEIKL